jgi:hypothetical protein
VDEELQRIYDALDMALSKRVSPPECPSIEQVQRYFPVKVVGVRVNEDNLIIDLEMPPIKFIRMSFVL